MTNYRQIINATRAMLTLLDKHDAGDFTGRADLDTGLAALTAVADWQPPAGAPTLPQAMAAAIAAGKEPATDKTVQRAALLPALEQAQLQARTHAAADYAATIRQHLPELIANLADLYATVAAEPITQAAEQLQVYGIRTPADVTTTNLDPEPAVAWQQVRVATAKHHEILSALWQLCGAIDAPYPHPHLAWIDPGEKDWTALQTLINTSLPDLHPLHVLAAGMTPALTDHAGTAERQQRATSKMRTEADYERELAAAWRKQHGHGIPAPVNFA